MDFAKLLAKLDKIDAKKTLNEGWDDMMKDVEQRGKEEEKTKGTGKFDKKKISTGTVYTKKADKDQDDDKKVDESLLDKNDQDMEEGNEFSGARQDAIDAGKDEFEVDGKKYKVKESYNDKDMLADVRARLEKLYKTMEPEVAIEKVAQEKGMSVEELYDFLNMDNPMKESARPDFPDIDNDGDRQESISQAAKDAEEDKDQVKEVTAPGQEDWVKSNKERFIKQYGKEKGMKILYAKAWQRSKQKDESKKLEECWDQAMAQTEDNSGMNINASMDTRTGQKTLTVTAQGSAADDLAQILKLSGVMGGQSVVGPADEMAEEYANEPKPVVQSADAQFHQGNDMHREKGMHRGSYRQGDNPMAMANESQLSVIEQRLMEELDKIKAK